MDLETENRIAAILLKEAAELRRQAQTDGALAYLRQPTVRGRPNSRFLTATVLGVQQANRAVEVNEMWRLREKQLELDSRLRGRRHESTSGRGHGDIFVSRSRSNTDHEEIEPNTSASDSSKTRNCHDRIPMEGEGLRDDEVDEFLQSRTKRGRGAVGSRMDETGPCLPSSPDSNRILSESPGEELGKRTVLLDPEKTVSQRYIVSSDDESLRSKKQKQKMSLSKHHSRKHKSRESKDKRKKKTRKMRKRETITDNRP